MELRDLALLRELGERGSMAAAARALRVTPSAVSQRIRVIERSLGLRLIEPVGRGVRLTEPGRLLATGAVEVAEVVARVESRLAAFHEGVAGRVDVVTLPSAAVVLLPGLIAGLGEGVELHIHDHDVSETEYAALARDHDLVIGHRASAAPRAEWLGLRVVDLLREPIDIALPADHELATAGALRPRDIAGQRWIGVPEGYPFDDLRLAIESDAGVAFEVVQRVRDNRLVEALVAAGLGIGMLPRLSAAPGPGVSLVALTGIPTGRIVSALARPDVAERAVVRHVLGVLQRSAAAIGAATGPRARAE